MRQNEKSCPALIVYSPALFIPCLVILALITAIFPDELAANNMLRDS